MAQVKLHSEPAYNEAEFGNTVVSSTMVKVNGRWMVSLTAELADGGGPKAVINMPLSVWLHIIEVESEDEPEPELPE